VAGSSGLSLLEKAKILTTDSVEEKQATAVAIGVMKEMIDTNMLCTDAIATVHAELKHQEQTVESQEPNAIQAVPLQKDVEAEGHIDKINRMSMELRDDHH
ncbi:hypothetical protein ACH5RR_001091, partial [Cinchona calisaya]